MLYSANSGRGRKRTRLANESLESCLRDWERLGAPQGKPLEMCPAHLLLSAVTARTAGIWTLLQADHAILDVAWVWPVYAAGKPGPMCLHRLYCHVPPQPFPKVQPDNFL